MKLKYICYKSTGKGFIQTRKPLLVDKPLGLSFKNAPQGATAIFTNDEGTMLYRDLKDNSCQIPLYFLVGEVRVSVVVLDGRANSEKYTCESFYAEKKNDTLFIYPNGMDVPTQILDLYNEIQALKELIAKRDKKYEELEKRVESYETSGVELVFE